MIFPVGGGTAKGPRINGKIRPPGGDWGLLRVDNCFELDIRFVIETDDGAIILAACTGIQALTQAQVDAFLAGEIPEGRADIFVTPRFETSHEDYQWLTCIQTVGRGGVELEDGRLRVTYSWYVLKG